MQLRPISERRYLKPMTILFAGILGFAAAFVSMNLWHADLNYVLIGQGGDAVLEQMGIQNMLETGTRNHALRLGGVSGLYLYEYPVSDFINYAIMFVISLFTHNSARILNIFYILCYPLSAMTAAWAFLELKISHRVALFAAVLYACLPYHFLRNENHLLLSAYYMVPLASLAAFWFLGRDADYFFSRKVSFVENIKKNRIFLLALLFCLLISSTGLYYAFFSCFFLGIVLIKHICVDRKFSRSVLAVLAGLGTTFLGVVLNYMPTLIFRWSGGDRGTALVRPGEAAEIYGLKILDLVMPTMAHRNSFLRQIADTLHATEPLANENLTVSLGILGAIGFIALLIVPLVGFKDHTSPHFRRLRQASLFTLSGVLLAMQGGISALICRLVLSSIRGYSRICVYLAFFSLFATAILLDKLIFGKKFAQIQMESSDNKIASVNHKTKIRRTVFSLALIPLLVFGLYDQIPLNSVQNYAANIASDRSLQAFFAEVEASVPAGTLVYALPYSEFPEPYVSYGSSPYSLLNGYLCTKTLRWSCAAMVGTKASNWAEATSKLSAEQMIQELKTQGYGAIYIDFLNYPDDTLTKLAEQLQNITGSTPITSEDGTRFFLSL